MLEAARPGQGGVVLDSALVGQPQEGALVIAERVADLAMRALRPQRDGGDPGRRVLRHVLLHERRLARPYPHHRQRPVAQLADERISDGLQVVHQVTLAHLSSVEQRLVKMSEGDAGALLAAHGLLAATASPRKAVTAAAGSAAPYTAEPATNMSAPASAHRTIVSSLTPPSTCSQMSPPFLAMSWRACRIFGRTRSMNS